MTARQRHNVKALWPVDEVAPVGTPPWTIGAPCKYNPDLWFSDDPDDIAAAKAICTSVCPLERRIACMDYAFDKGIEYGVFGGVSREERVEKRCGACKQVKSVAAFGANVTEPDGLQHSCRDCVNAAAREAARRAREKERRANPAMGIAERVTYLREAQERRTAAANDRVALYAELWWDQRLPRSVAMKQLGIGSARTAQRYEAQIRKQKNQEVAA